jgi:hypothetical protein
MLKSSTTALAQPALPHGTIVKVLPVKFNLVWFAIVPIT